jgi:hypothetical protein
MSLGNIVDLFIVKMALPITYLETPWSTIVSELNLFRDLN